MIDIDKIEAQSKASIQNGYGHLPVMECGNAVKISELIGLLRQYEKDAARYRWLRDESAFTREYAPLVFFTDTNGDQTEFNYKSYSCCVLHDELLDAAIDEAMQRSGDGK